jgi:catechol 2,3-dioxygenase-like lactoylglutathione lyase family enzyme
MKFEHFALNVPDAAAQARWYVQHLGFKVVRSRVDAPYTHFLADDTGRVVVELYSNPKATIPDYGAQHPLVFHFAVVAQDAKAESARLQQAGATVFLEEPQPDGSMLIMMRDPWKVALQLCQRTNPMPFPTAG